MRALRTQLRIHSVALISLAVALSSLGYNTWRNEQTEANRNVRAAGIELLLKLGELERTVFFRQYGTEDKAGDPKTGWARVLTVRDLGKLMPGPARSTAAELVETWRDGWIELGTSEKAVIPISNAIDRTREHVLLVLSELR